MGKENLMMDYEKEIEKRNEMGRFLDTVANDELATLQLLDILKSKHTSEFQALSLKLGFDGFTMEEFMYYWSTREYGLHLTGGICALKMTEVLDGCMAEGRMDDVLGLLRGEQETYDKIRQEIPFLRDDPCNDFQWFYRHYIEGYFGLRYLFKMSGVEFPEEDDEE